MLNRRFKITTMQIRLLNSSKPNCYTATQFKRYHLMKLHADLRPDNWSDFEHCYPSDKNLSWEKQQLFRRAIVPFYSSDLTLLINTDAAPRKIKIELTVSSSPSIQGWFTDFPQFKLFPLLLWQPHDPTFSNIYTSTFKTPNINKKSIKINL